MTNPIVTPTHTDCGECGASVELQWEPAKSGVYFGHARCSCGAGVVSISSEAGLSFRDVQSFLLALERSQNRRCGSLIA